MMLSNGTLPAVYGTLTPPPHSAVFVCFVTRTFVSQVLQGAEASHADLQQHAFCYAGAVKPRKMVAVVLEPGMLDASDWQGPVGARLGAQPAIDFTSEDKLPEAVVALAKWMRENV